MKRIENMIASAKLHLGVILVFESLALMMLVRDISVSKADFPIALLVALMAGFLQYGFVIGLIVGTLLTYLVSVAENENRRCYPCPCFRRGKLVPAKAGSRGPERKSWIPAFAGMTNTVSATVTI